MSTILINNNAINLNPVQEMNDSFSLSSLELSEKEIDEEILPQLKFLYQSNDLKLKEIALLRLSEIQTSKSARHYLEELITIDESDYLTYLKRMAQRKSAQIE